MTIAEAQYERLVTALDALLDHIGEDETHPLAVVMDVIGDLIMEYEDENVPELTTEKPKSLQELFAYVESVEFDANIRIQSGLTPVKRLLETDASVAELLEELFALLSAVQKTFDRLMELLNENSEPPYLHPRDTALAGYIYVLSRANKEVAKPAMEALSQTSNLWWAKRLANEFLQAYNMEN